MSHCAFVATLLGQCIEITESMLCTTSTAGLSLSMIARSLLKRSANFSRQRFSLQGASTVQKYKHSIHWLDTIRKIDNK